MTWFIARASNNKVASVNDNEGLDEIYRYINKGFTLYRIEPAAIPGQFTLIPQQLNPASIVTETVTTGGTLEDV